MAVITDTTVSADLAAGMDIEMVMNFQQEYDRLADVLGIVTPEVMAAGTALYQFKVEGNLSTVAVAEGDETPPSKYKTKKVPIGEVELFDYQSECHCSKTSPCAPRPRTLPPPAPQSSTTR